MAPRANIRIVKHQVQRGDTLQGIALKYGVTMEEVKRENRLWTTDSLFLREFLDIPVPSSPSTGETSLPRQASPSPQRTVSLDTVEVDAVNKDENIRDFLGRIDTSIKKTKSQIKELNLPDDGDDNADNGFNSQCPPSVPGLTLSPALDSVSYQNGSFSSLGDVTNNGRGFSNVEFSPKTTVVTSGRKVKTSLQKHRREHEQMFEL